MTESAQWIGATQTGSRELRSPVRLSTLRFLLRYPIFLLAFGPPILRPNKTFAGVDTSQSHFDLWSILQVGWLFAIALRALIRMSFDHQILLSRQARSILKYVLFLGLVLTMSITYSPGPALSAEFSVLYFVTWVCIVEFLSDAYHDPPNWLQCLFTVRLLLLLLMALVAICFVVQPSLVMEMKEGQGIRLGGGAVAPVGVIAPIIAIISAYSFLNSLERKSRSLLFVLVGIIGTVVTQARGSEIALFICLAILGFGWARSGKRIAYLFIATTTVFIFLATVVLADVGADRIWERFNRGQDVEQILTLTGRTEMWASVIEYSFAHPQGMGYMAGIRTFHGGHFATNLHTILNSMGGVDSSYIEVLADAGWLSLAFYLIILVKTATLAWGYAKKRTGKPSAPDFAARHALRCTLLLFFFCLLGGVEDTGFCNPLRPEFYLQNISIAMIVGICTSLYLASRARRTYSPV
ncbi:MAG: O-antigen ligase family protein [Terracidiphilus sp.]